MAKLKPYLTNLFVSVNRTALSTRLTAFFLPLRLSWSKYLKKAFMSNLYTDLYRINVDGFHRIQYDNDFSALKRLKFIPTPAEYLLEAYLKVNEHRNRLSDNKDVIERNDIISRIERIKKIILTLDICRLGLLGCTLNPKGNEFAENVFRQQVAKLGYVDDNTEYLIGRIHLGTKQKEVELADKIKELDVPLKDQAQEKSLEGWELLYQNIDTLEAQGRNITLKTNMVQFCMAVNACTRNTKIYGTE